MSSVLCSLLLAVLLFAVANAQSGDSLAATLVTRQPVFSLNFSIAPTGTTGWTWASVDSSDSTQTQTLHQGLAVLNASVAAAYIDLTTATGANSAGAVLGPIGGASFYPVGNAQAGWSLEFVVKFTYNQPSTPPLLLLADANADSLSVGFGVHQDYDTNDPDVPNRLELVNANNASATGVPLSATFGLVEFISPVPGQWYHIALCLASGSNSLGSGLATWYIYVNGLPRALADALSPNATLTALQGANLPQPVTRTVQQLGGWAELDAFRVYDYVLSADTVSALASAYGLLSTPPAPAVSYSYPASAESSAMLAVVPTPPILDLDFSVNPAGLVPGIDYTTYSWLPSDASDPVAVQSLHSGLVQFNGSNYIDLSVTTGPTSCGVLLPLFGLPGSGSGAQQGLSFEIVFKYPEVSGNGGGDKLFDFGQGGSETVDLAYQGNQLQLEQQNQVAPGTDAGYVSNWIGNGNGVSFANGVWYHFVWSFSSVSLTNYTATWSVYVNGSLIPNSPFLNGLFPPPVVRPIALLAGAAYNNANLAYTLDTFRIYDYALTQQQVEQLAALKGLGPLYTPPAAGCSTASNFASSGDALAATLVPRAPVFNLNFSSSPSCTTNATSAFEWAATDPADSGANATAHQGVVFLNQSITGAFIDLTTAIGINSAGVVLPSIGGQGFYPAGNALAGWSLEFVVKFSSLQPSTVPLLLLQDALNDVLGVGFSVHSGDFDNDDPDVPNRLELVVSNNASVTGVPLSATFGLVEFISPVPGQWYHIALCLASGSNSLGSGLATWYIYVNGLPRALADALSPNATLTALQGANLPQPVTRTVQQLGGWAELDAFRVYDYVLSADTVSALASAYGLLSTPPAPAVSYSYPASAESSAMLAVVPTPPILDLDFSVNPAGLVPGIDYTTYSWLPSDASDPVAVQSLHSGLVQFNGSNYIDLSVTTGPTSCGVLLPLFGLPGSGSGAQQGLSFEIVFKYPEVSGNGGGDKLFDFGQGGSETVDLAYQGNQLQLEQQNQVAPGTDAGYVSNWIGNGNGVSFANGVWYHFVWSFSSVSLTNYTATWSVYVNGSLIPNSPFLNGLFPPPVVRPIALLAGAAYNNANLAYTLDTFRIYDYALTQQQVEQLAALKGLGPLYTGPPPAGSSSSSSAAVPASSSSGLSPSSTSAAPSAGSSSSTAPPLAVSSSAAASSSSSAPAAVASSSSAAPSLSSAAPSSSSSAAPSLSSAAPSSSSAAVQPSSSSSTALPPATFVTSSSSTGQPAVVASSSSAAPPVVVSVTSSSSSPVPQKVSAAVGSAQLSALSLLVCIALPMLLSLLSQL